MITPLLTYACPVRVAAYQTKILNYPKQILENSTRSQSSRKISNGEKTRDCPTIQYKLTNTKTFKMT